MVRGVVEIRGVVVVCGYFGGLCCFYVIKGFF